MAADVLSTVGEGFVGIRLELFLFAIALGFCLLRFKSVVPSPSR